MIQQVDCTVKTGCISMLLRHVLGFWLYSTHCMQSKPFFPCQTMERPWGFCHSFLNKIIVLMCGNRFLSLCLLYFIFLFFLFLVASDKWFTLFILKCLDWFCNAINPIKVCVFKLCHGFGVFICQSVWVRTKYTVKGRKA